MNTNEIKTPKTDAQADHPANFDLDNARAERLNEPQVLQVVPADFARQLEIENVTLREALKNVCAQIEQNKWLIRLKPMKNNCECGYCKAIRLLNQPSKP